MSDSAKDLVMRMLHMDPKQRISAHEALIHPWFLECLETNIPQSKQKIHAALDNFRKFNSANKIKQAALGFMI